MVRHKNNADETGDECRAREETEGTGSEIRAV